MRLSRVKLHKRSLTCRLVVGHNTNVRRTCVQSIGMQRPVTRQYYSASLNRDILLRRSARTSPRSVPAIITREDEWRSIERDDGRQFSPARFPPPPHSTRVFLRPNFLIEQNENGVFLYVLHRNFLLVFKKKQPGTRQRRNMKGESPLGRFRAINIVYVYRTRFPCTDCVNQNKIIVSVPQRRECLFCHARNKT